MRTDGRGNDQLRPIKITRDFTAGPLSSTLFEMGRTKVLCTVTLENGVPNFLMHEGSGWVTAEYGMLPGSTAERKGRDRGGRVDGRTMEIQRLIGRALRAATDTEKLGARTLWVDCDVLEADGGTRTAAINGAFACLADACQRLVQEKILPASPLRCWVAAVSVGIVGSELVLDLSYEEDSRAQVDLNAVFTDRGDLVEIQGTAEGRPFSQKQLGELLALGRQGIEQILRIQKDALALPPSLRPSRALSKKKGYP